MSALRLTFIFALTLSLMVFPGNVVTIRHVRADPAPAAPSDPSTQWVPAGPMTDRIVISPFSTDSDLTSNRLDLTDWSVSATNLPQSCPSPGTILCDSRFYVTAPAAGYHIFGIDFNHANTFFGINFGFGKDTNPDNLRAINFRQGVAHLIEKTSVVSLLLANHGQALDNPIPKAQANPHSGLPFDSTCQPGPAPSCLGPYSYGGYNLSGVCGSGTSTSNTGWDSLDAQFRAAGQTCRSAFKYGVDTVDSAGIVTASAANPDFCDAADHWIAAGLATARSATDCHLTGLSSQLSSGHISFFVRSDDPARLSLGTSLAARICELINGAGRQTCSQVAVTFGSINDARLVVFPTSGTNLSWHMYTSADGAGATPENVWALYNSQFAGASCGGTPGPFGSNYAYFCNSRFDHYSSMIEFNSTTTGSIASLQIAAQLFGNNTAKIPIYNFVNQHAYLKGWTGVNNGPTTGPDNSFTLMNMWNSAPAVSGSIRWGFGGIWSNPNPMSFTSVEESYIVSSVYDQLIQTNPYSPTDVFGWMVNQWQVLPPQPGDPYGTVSDVKFNLRNDVFFHDGRQLTASDVIFSWQAYTNTGGVINPNTAGIVGVRAQNDFNFIVNLNSNSVYAILNVGGLPILPQHLLAADTTTKCTIVNTPACSLAAAPEAPSGFVDTRDLMSSSFHQYIGSGPWVCRDANTNQAGGGCIQNGCTPSGGCLMTLTRNGFNQAGTANGAYFRDSAKYAQWEWANPFNHIQVDILDVSSAASCLGKPPIVPGCARYDTPAARISCVAAAGSCNVTSMAGLGGNNDGTVDFIEVQQVFRWFGVSWNSPFSYSALSSTTGCGGSGCGAQAFPQTLYEGGIVYAIIP